MTQMTNQEAVEILINYLKKNSSVEDAYRALANSLIDYVRMYKFYKNSVFQSANEEEKLDFFRFIKRLSLNVQEIQKVLRGECQTPFHLKHFNEVKENV